MTRRLHWLLGIMVAFSNAPAQPLEKAVAHAMEFAGSQLRRTVTELDDSVRYPRSTLPDGTWKTTKPREWTSGFFPGALWMMEERTHDPFFGRSARRWTDGLKEMQFFGGTHDIGFIIFSSYGRAYKSHPSDADKNVILQTAQTLTTRFNPIAGCIRSWDNRKWGFPVIIDNMMNLELLFWASENGGTSRMREVAVSHARMTMKNHFRADGGTYHVLDYDTTNGTVIAKNTHQGYADESVWTRGQAWAIYGFTVSYRFTKDEEFLKTARKAADYFISHLPADFIPYWDFQAPEIPNEPRDASAASIAASGLLELSTFVRGDARTGYRKAAESILQSLCSSNYLAEGTSSRGILNHATGSKPGGSEVDVSLIYGDYYFLEALMRYQQQKK